MFRFFLRLVDPWSWNWQNVLKSITNYHSTLCKMPEQQLYHLHHSCSPKSCRLQDGCEVQYTQERRQMDRKFEKKKLNKRRHLEDLGMSIRWIVDDEQVQCECAGLIRLALNWDHKQTVPIKITHLWVSQNSGKVLHQISNYQLVKVDGVCSFNHSSNISSCVSTPV